MSWNTVYTISQMLGVLAVAATLAAGAFTVYAGWKANEAQKQENQLKEEQRERERQISDENIATANAAAAAATEGLATADVRIAQANEQAQNAIAAAAEARAKQGELALEYRAKQTELADAQTKLVEEQKVLADAQRKQAEAELALRKTLEEVGKRQGPRTLTQTQRAEIISSLKAYDELMKAWLTRLLRPDDRKLFESLQKQKRVTIVTLDAAEASNYASQLNEAILAAGWETVVVSGRSQVPTVFGIVCQDCSNIESALNAAHIAFARESGRRGAQCTLVIGLKEP